MPSMDTTTPALVGTHPPERLVPRPRGWIGMRSTSAQRISSRTCSTVRGRTIASTGPLLRLASDAYTRSASSSNAASSVKSASRKERCSGVRAGFAAFIACSLSACAGKIGNLAPVGAACSVTGTTGIAWGCHTT